MFVFRCRHSSLCSNKPEVTPVGGDSDGGDLHVAGHIFMGTDHRMQV